MRVRPEPPGPAKNTRPGSRPGVDAAHETTDPLRVAAPRTVIPRLSAVKDYVGVPLGPSEWVEIDQARIDGFANVTGDHQWIHVDPERANLESPWKTTIAHGYLTLAMVPDLLARVLAIGGWSTAVNTGLDKLRLPAPVPSDSRVRLHAEIRETRDLPNGGIRVTFAIRFEVEGAAKPALLANVNYAYLP